LWVRKGFDLGIKELFEGTPWLKIDFCIGKIVKEGGD
jgi:hypothetical protein